MSFVPSGKKAASRRRRDERRVNILDRAVASARHAVRSPRLCLPMCVLLERILVKVLPVPHFSLRLGSLQVHPEDKSVSPIAFDPRGPDGIDGGFHAWLEDTNGALLDPSIFPTLDAEGYDVDADNYFIGGGRTFVRAGLVFVYEELPELELLGLEKSELQLARLMDFALLGEMSPPGVIYLDVGWRTPSVVKS
jgi:hypothetical protein